MYYTRYITVGCACGWAYYMAVVDGCVIVVLRQIWFAGQNGNRVRIGHYICGSSF